MLLVPPGMTIALFPVSRKPSPQMLFKRFLRLHRSATGTLETGGRSAPEDLDAFISESAPDAELNSAALKTQNRGATAGRLVPVLAALAILEAVPAGLWLHRTFAVPEASASASGPPAPASLATLAVGAPCEAEEAPSLANPAGDLAAKRTGRSSPTAVAGTAGAARAPAPGSVGGLLAVAAPVPMHMYVRGRLVGTTEADTIMLPVGTHEIVFANERAGYEVRRTVTVQAGRTASVKLEAPPGTVHVNASPWAEVWIDNQRVGETPLGNLHVPIGTREFVFRHPELGERRKTAFVTLKEPIRVSLDMRAQQ